MNSQEAADLAYITQLTPVEVKFNLGLIKEPARTSSSATHKRLKCAHEGCSSYAVTKLPLKPHQKLEKFCPSHRPTRKRPRLHLVRTTVYRSPDVCYAELIDVDEDEDLAEFVDSDITILGVSQVPSQPKRRRHNPAYNFPDEDEKNSVTSPDTIDRLLDTVELDKESNIDMPEECDVCSENTFTVPLEPCGHWLCKTCIINIQGDDDCIKCPFCRTTVDLPDWLKDARKRNTYRKLCSSSH